jgi:hypothetical protein
MLVWAGVAGLSFAACQVYDPSDLVGGSAAASGLSHSGTGGGAGKLGAAGSGASSGTAAGVSGGGSGTGASSGTSAAGVGGDQNLAGESGLDGGAAGEAGSDGAAGSVSVGGSGGGGRMGASGSSGEPGQAGSAASVGGATSGAGAAGLGGAGMSGAGGSSAGAPGAAGAGGASGSSAAGAAGAPTVELEGTATADSSQNSSGGMHPPAHGNDGDLGTRWCAADPNTGHYWTLDLGALHTLSRIEVVWEYPSQATGLPYGYVVAVSDDGASFTTSIDRSATTDTMKTQTSNFPPATTGRYVRITVTGLPSGTWASFWEAHVFGA